MNTCKYFENLSLRYDKSLYSLINAITIEAMFTLLSGFEKHIHFEVRFVVFLKFHEAKSIFVR